jgi:hypothetical protein
MTSYKKIVIAKIAWSSEYQGGPVFGNHKYLIKQAKKKGTLKKNENGYYALALGHEAYNFRPYKGVMYAYIPPIGEQFVPPKPAEKDDWLIVFVSRVSGNGDLVAVGWYENASFCWTEELDEEESQYLIRKEYTDNPSFPLDGDNNHYHYCVETEESNAHFIPEEYRKRFKIDKRYERIVQRSIAYAKGNKTVISEDNRQYLIDFAKKVTAFKVDNNDADSDALSNKAARFIPPRTETKKSIEESAILCAESYFKSLGYKIIDVQKENLGWDITIQRIINRKLEELHVEVKGTSRDEFHLFLSKNEYNTMLSDDNWRIFIVKNALSKNKEYDYLDRKDFMKLYFREPFCFECQKKEKL